MTENYNHIQDLAVHDVEVLKRKGVEYGSSWRLRGGVGAFMMLARKWDRIEKAALDNGYDIFAALTKDPIGLADDIGDLRRYLLLVESYITAPAMTIQQVIQEAGVDASLDHNEQE